MSASTQQDVPSIIKVSQWNSKGVQEETESYLKAFARLDMRTLCEKSGQLPRSMRASLPIR